MVNKLKMMIFGHRTNTEYWIPIKDIIITNIKSIRRYATNKRIYKQST